MQFVDNLPPARTGRAAPIDWAAAKAELIDNPGQWGLMAEDIAASTPNALRTGTNKNFRGKDLEDFEFAVRKDPEKQYGKGRTDLWGRYTGAEGKGRKRARS